MDWFTNNPGTFEKEKITISKLSKLGTIIRVASVVTPKNLSQMRETALLAKSLGATVCGFSPVIPQGRGSDTSMLLSIEEYQTFTNNWNDLRQELGNFIFHLSESPEAMATMPDHCGAGSRSVCITPNGDVKICQMSSAEMINLGNAFELTASEIFDTGLASQISNLIPPNQEICGSCENLGFCINCINRGLIMATQLGKGKCKWYMEYAYDILEHNLD